MTLPKLTLNQLAPYPHHDIILEDEQGKQPRLVSACDAEHDPTKIGRNIRKAKTTTSASSRGAKKYQFTQFDFSGISLVLKFVTVIEAGERR